MTQQNATMFLNNISVVDHCVIHNDGSVVGGSYNPSFLVGGRIDPVEQVVVDFSTVKKQIKGLIDDHSKGFDHKCWIVEGYSQAIVKVNDVIVTDFSQLIALEDTQQVVVSTPLAEIRAPRNAFKFIPHDPETDDCDHFDQAAGKWFERDLKAGFPNLDFVCKNNIEAHLYLDDMPHHYFSYAHGLKDSTSYGCQNIAHGHLSFIQIDAPNAAYDEVESVLETIAEELDGSMFINKVNVVASVHRSDSPLEVSMGYQSYSRGHFSAIWVDSDYQKVTILDSETTIEHLVAYIANRYKDLLQSINATQLFVSEGLSKGAYLDLTTFWTGE